MVHRAVGCRDEECRLAGWRFVGYRAVMCSIVGAGLWGAGLPGTGLQGAGMQVWGAGMGGAVCRVPQTAVGPGWGPVAEQRSGSAGGCSRRGLWGLTCVQQQQRSCPRVHAPGSPGGFIPARAGRGPWGGTTQAARKCHPCPKANRDHARQPHRRTWGGSGVCPAPPAFDGAGRGGRAPLCCRPCWARGGCAGAKAEMRHTVWLRGFGPARPGAARRGWGCLRLGGSGCSARCCCPPPCCPPSRPAIKRLCPCHGRRRALRQDCRCARTTPCPGSAGGLRRENGEMGKWGGPGANGCCAPRWLRGGRAQHGAGVTPQRAPTGTRHGVGWCKGGLGAAGTGCGCARLAAGTPVHRVGVLSRRSPQALPSVPSPLVLLPAGAAGHGGSGRGLGALGRRRALLGGGCNPSCVISQSSAVRARGLCLAQRGAPSPAQPRGEERGHCSRCPLHRTGGLVWGFGTR